MALSRKKKNPRSQKAARNLLRYALPSVVGMLIVGLQTIIDGLFVAKGVGTLGLAAVNLSMPLISVLASVCIMITSGGVVIAGTAQGRGDHRLTRGYATLTFVVLAATIALLSLTIGLNLHRICLLLGADGPTYPYVRNYLGIIGCAFFFYCIPNFTEAFARLAGRPNWVFVSGAICCTVNVVLDYFFVLRWQWGVSGAAIATCAANSTAAIVLSPKVPWGRLRGSWRQVAKIFYNGSSEMLTSVSAAVTTFIFNLVLMDRTGPTGVAALTIVCYINLVVNFSIYGLSQALYPLMSFEMGARNYRGVRSLLAVSALFSAAIGIGTYLIVTLFRHPIVAAFTGDDLQLQAITTTATTFVTLHFLFSFANIISSSFLTAVERPWGSALIAFCRSILFVLAPLFILTPAIGDLGIWLSMPIAEVLTLAISIPLTLHTLKKIRFHCAGRTHSCTATGSVRR